MNTHVLSNVAGYNLIEIDHDKWVLQVLDGDMYGGTFKEVIYFAATRFGFSLLELEVAIKEMLDQEHNAAHFGMQKTFIFTFIQELSTYRKTG